MSGTRYDEKQRQTIRKLYEKDQLSMEKISQMEEMPTPKTIRNILVSMKPKVKLRGIRRTFNRKRILRDIEKTKKNNTEIAAKHGCTRQFVHKIRNGVIPV